ncbi:vitamin B12-dependent ribonucleotide reductase [bacterium]|nr:vitamin B12-dependent ribonucleotide reductase [bacterium]
MSRKLSGFNDRLTIPFGSDQSPFEERCKLSKNAMIVLKKRYLKRNMEGEVIEQPEEMFRRVAESVSEVDKLYNPGSNTSHLAAHFYGLMIHSEFLPNSPTLMNAGRHLGQLSACFVLPVDDSMEGIFSTLKNTALIHKSGGGTGFSFSKVRPRNDIVHSTVGISSGPISFMQVYDAATETVKQGGTRRGANMGILRVDHPDIVDFITCKRQREKLTNFNISVAVTEDFMKAVENNREYAIINPRNEQEMGRLNASEVFDLMVESTWASGEPGIVFIDRINADNPIPHVGKIESTNPCGEQPLLPYESCNLGSINLSAMVKEGKIDYEHLGEVVENAVHFLDNVIDLNRYPLPEIETTTKANRKIGLGIMGFADMLIKLGIPYNSDKALDTAEDVMSFVQAEGRKASERLGHQRGSFPNFDGSTYAQKGMTALRNATVTTIAPTGSISIISDVSSGIEPLFALAFTRNILDNQKLLEVNHLFKEVAEEEGFYSEELMKRVAEHGSIKDIQDIPQDVRQLFVTAHDITPEWHVKMQAVFQKYTDNAVSKTVNFSREATKDDVREVFMLAYKLGCKGITIFRDGCRGDQVLTFGSEKKEEVAENKALARIPQGLSYRPRPQIATGRTWKVGTGCGNLYITINEDEYGPCEVFSHLGKSGGCAASQSEAISRLISLGLRSGIKPEAIIKQLSGIRCPSPLWEKGTMILSCPDGIGKALKWHLEKKMDYSAPSLPLQTTQEQEENQQQPVNAEFADKETVTQQDSFPLGVCPECGFRLSYEEGCVTCKSCGYSKCG